MYPGTREESEELGNEFAGVITEVGPGSGLEAGRRVMGLVSHAFRSHVLVPADSVVEMPEWMTFEEAATIPTVFLTAHGALVERARLRAGEKALIHAGAGGVDQAAIQVARAHGAIVCATAGSEAKRNHLREQGVEHVFDSRTPDFADALLTVCPGGVDVVLNSLAGELMRRSFSVLAPFGRFIEIGKVDLHADTRIGLRQFRQNAQYHTLDLEEMARHRPDELRRWWREIAAAIASRRYRPLARQKYPITEIAGACRQMAQARHIGKLVLEFPSNPVLAGVSAREGVRFGGNGTYVVAGGNGGFGLEVARWLASRGARHLALLSRSGVRTADALDVVAAMRARGVEVMDLRCDITKAEDVERALASMDAALPPLRGVFHSAMVLDDVFIADMEPAQLHAALDPKMLGAWNLHRATIERPLEWFVCFSSFSALLGMFKQAGYNAGNTFLDALAWHRRALGLPALTVSWGALAGTGFVERNPKTAEFLDRTGMKALPASEALAALDRLMRLDGGHLAVGHVNFADLRRLSSTFADNPVFETVMSMGEETGCATARRRILGAPRDQRLGLMEDFVAAQLAAVFRAEAGRFHRDEKLTEAGLDSLLAVELMVSIESELGITAPMSNLLGGPTVAGLARTLLESLEASAGKGP
jgi:NADPH:quinone reductase-like Zn-dependent oxidoreductase/NAD(P)-dependent dehydrogenase (short-subunit alcohol dehydrogenase family)/acyl carrier protein